MNAHPAAPRAAATTTLPRRACPSRSMRAIVQRRYGSAETLELDRFDRPSAGAGEVLVEVRAAGLDRGTWHLMTGVPYAARLAFGLRGPGSPCPGRDLSGIVVAVGAGRHRVRAGRRGVRRRHGHLRRVRRGTRGQAGPQADPPHVRAGRGRADLGSDRAPGPARRRPPRDGPARARHGRLRRRRDVRRPDRQGPRAPTSPACAAPPRSTSSARSAPTT